MPDYRNPETLLIRRQEDEAARARRPPIQSWPSSPRAAAIPPLALGREKALPAGTLTAGRLRVSTTLNAAELLAVPAPNGNPRLKLRIRLPDRTVTADIAAKSLRRAQKAVREAGADNIPLVLQGRLAAGDTIAEARLSAQSKAARPMER